MDDLVIGGTITWNVNTMKYDVKGTTLADSTQSIEVKNRSDLPVYAFATVDDVAGDGISIAAEQDSATNRLTIAKATAGTGADGTPTKENLTINLTSSDWGEVAKYYAQKRLDNETIATFRIATVTVTITKD